MAALFFCSRMKGQAKGQAGKNMFFWNVSYFMLPQI